MLHEIPIEEFETRKGNLEQIRKSLKAKRFYNDQIIRKCISNPEIQSVLHFAIQQPEVAITDQLKRPGRYLNMSSIGP
ncbi:hypothetical protein CR513_13910, partial [Mucuna pruriens]